MNTLARNSVPQIARGSFSCPCGARIVKGGSYMIKDDRPVCLDCALPVKERRLRLIAVRQII